MKWKNLLWLVVLAMVFAACGQPQTVEVTRVVTNDFAIGGESVALEKTVDFDDGAGFAGNSPAPQSSVDQNQLPTQPLIIRTGTLELVVADTDEAVTAITSLVESNEGWVLNSNIYQYGDFRRGDISVRVPVAGFNSILETLKGLAVEVRTESLSGEDVTEEFVDVSARLTNLEATADRVRTFLEEAKNVEEALAVNAELSRLEAQIESLKGRQNYLSQSAAFSTIHISLTPDAASKPVEIGGWQLKGTVKEAFESLVNALQGITQAAIWLLIYVLPILLIIAIPVTLFYKLGKRVWRLRRNRPVQITE